MQELIDSLESRLNYKEELKEICRKNGLGLNILNGLTTKKMKTIYERTQKHYEANEEKAKSQWFENELRIFYWSLLIESFMTSTPINQFNDDNWDKFKTLFPPKEISIFRFQAQKLLSTQAQQLVKRWVQQESQLLLRVLENKDLLDKWSEVSRCFYEASERKFYRSSKQCREQWFNHLDVSKKHGDWSHEEDSLILSYVLKNGHKWAQLCKDLLPERTQHMIKNRYKSILNRTKGQLQNKGISSERKIIRRTLNNFKNEFSEEEIPKKNIVTLKTNETQNQEKVQEERDSFLERPNLGFRNFRRLEQNKQQYNPQNALLKTQQLNFPPQSYNIFQWNPTYPFNNYIPSAFNMQPTNYFEQQHNFQNYPYPTYPSMCFSMMNPIGSDNFVATQLSKKEKYEVKKEKAERQEEEGQEEKAKI